MSSYALIKILLPWVSEKLSKYEDLQIEITRMWQMKTEITTGSQVRYELILDASAVL